MRHFQAKVARLFPVRQLANLSKAQRQSLSLRLTQDAILAVNFEKNPHVCDVQEATMCIVVLASDGQRGSISHLTTPARCQEQQHKASLFAWALQQYWGKSAAICLVGGTTGISELFIHSLAQELTAREFTVSLESSHCDLGGCLIDRQATLEARRVRVERRCYRGPVDTVELQFPNLPPLAPN